MIQGMAAEHSAIGTRIKKRRQALGIRSQQELAERVGVNRTTVSDWESGRHFPARYIGVLEKILGISLSGDGEPEPDIISPHTRMLLREDLSPEDYERVMALLEKRDPG